MQANISSIKIQHHQMSMQKESPIRLQYFDQCHTWLPLLHLLLSHISPPVTAQPVAPVVEPDSNKSLVTIMAIVAVMFLISGFLSLYSRKCGDRQEQARGTLNHALPTGGTGNQSQTEPNGLSQEIIETFPTFLYSTVKGLKIGNNALACAVCLNEFEDDESLRLIPKCCHVYHLACIDAWFASHTTCPLCRANLVPKPDDVNINVNEYLVSTIPDDHEHEHEDEYDTVIGVGDEDQKRDDDVESPKVDLLRRIRTMNHSRPSRSRSTGFLSALSFPRSNSMGQLTLPVENFERFTLRLPEEVRSQMLNSTLKRANSCVCFTRMSSGMWGYRTRSVGSGRGKGYVLYEKFGTNEEQWGLGLTPPSLLVKSSWNRSTRKSSSPVQCSGGVALDNNIGERSSDFLRLG